MFIQTATTDNPLVVKFLPGRAVLSSGNAEFPDVDAAARSPLAKRLFAVEGVESVTLGTDSIGVEVGASDDWPVLKPQVLAAIMDHFTAGDPAILGEGSGEDSEAAESDDPALAAQIKELVETRIRPAVRDGDGEIAFHSLKNGTVYLKLEGAAFGLLPGVQNMIRHYHSEVSAVRDYRESFPKPGLETPVGKAIQTLLDERINPSVASHGGHISLIDVKEDTAFIRLEGGCQGCGMADVTLKEGIETEIKKEIPEIAAVLDTTDHAEGKNPYDTPQ